MKSIERRFNQLEFKNPGWSSMVCFLEAIRGQGFSQQSLSRWFNKLVEKEDYSSSDKKEILRHIIKLSKPAHDNQK